MAVYVRCTTVIPCAWPKSPPLLEQPASRGSHALFPVSGLRTTVVVHYGITRYGRQCLYESPDDGGLYALRAGRCGCDSLSLAGSRQRVKSLRSSVRLRLVFCTARSILSRRVFRYAPHTSSEGSQESETVPSAIAPVTDSPEEFVNVRSRYSPLRSVPSLRRVCPHSARTSLQRTDSATLHGFPRSHLSLPASRLTPSSLRSRNRRARPH